MSIENIHLYGALDANVADTYKAKEHLDKAGIEYVNLFYTDLNQIENVLKPVGSWFPDKEISSFPFVVWDEDGVRKVANGLKEIKAANLKPVPAEKPLLKSDPEA